MLNEAGFAAAEVNGDSKDRAEILKDFEDGKYNVLCNSMLLTEGWDCPSVDCIVVLRPTKNKEPLLPNGRKGYKTFSGNRKNRVAVIGFSLAHGTPRALPSGTFNMRIRRGRKEDDRKKLRKRAVLLISKKRKSRPQKM